MTEVKKINYISRMEKHIKDKLKNIEEQYSIKVLYACETGSRAWGFPSPDSDYDVRMIYMHEPNWYLSLSDKKDTIELMLDDGELDITGWDFKKCLKLLWKSNGALLERIQSPIVYQTIEGLTEDFKKYADKCFAPIAAMHHYSGMAKNSFDDIEGKEEVKLKKLFYALRATLSCKWILEKDSIPPIVFITMVNELNFDSKLKERIKQLIELKSGQNESYIHPAEKELSEFIREQLNIANEKANTLQGRKDKIVDLDEFFRHGLKTYWK
jgi:predicted nucleotidyltransferase